jgi:hypothetical protein
MEPEFGNLVTANDFGNRDHLDRVVFGEVVADSHADLAPLAPIHRNVGGVPLDVIIDRIRLRAKLRAKSATRLRTNVDIDLRYRIHASLLSQGTAD